MLKRAGNPGKKQQKNKMDSEYIKKSHQQVLKENKEKFLHGKLVYVQDPFLNDIDLDYVKLKAADNAIYYFANDNLEFLRLEKQFKEKKTVD